MGIFDSPDPTDPTYTPDDIIKLQEMRGRDLWGIDPGKGTGAGLAGLFSGLGSGAYYNNARDAIRHNQALTAATIKGIGDQTDQGALAKYLMNSGIPQFQAQGAGIYAQNLDPIHQAQVAQAQNQVAGQKLLQQQLNGLPIGAAGRPAITSMQPGAPLPPGAPPAAASPGPGQPPSQSPSASPGASGEAGTASAPPEVHGVIQQAEERLAAAQQAAPNVARVVNTEQGQIAVDARNAPLFNLSQMARDANIMGRIGLAYGLNNAATLSEKQFEFINNQIKSGAQLNQAGGVTPIQGAAEASARQKGMEKAAEAEAEATQKRAGEYVSTSMGAKKLQDETSFINGLIDKAQALEKKTGIKLFGPTAGADWMVTLRSSGAAPAIYNEAGRLQQQMNMAFNGLQADWAKGEFPTRITNADLLIAKTIKPNLMLESPTLAREMVTRMYDAAESEKIRHDVYLKHGVQAAEDPTFNPYIDARLGRKAGQPWTADTAVKSIQDKFSIPDNRIQQLLEHPEIAPAFNEIGKQQGAPGNLGDMILAISRARQQRAQGVP